MWAAGMEPGVRKTPEGRPTGGLPGGGGGLLLRRRTLLYTPEIPLSRLFFFSSAGELDPGSWTSRG